MKYNELESVAWTALMDNDTLFNYGGALPPMSVHYPIQPAHSRDFVQVEPSFTVCRRRVYPNLVAGEQASRDFVGQIETLAAQFAFADPPFPPLQTGAAERPTGSRHPNVPVTREQPRPRTFG